MLIINYAILLPKKYQNSKTLNNRKPTFKIRIDK